MKNKKLISSIVLIFFISILGVFLINSKSQYKSISDYIISNNYFGVIPKNIIYNKDPIKEIKKIIP